MFLENLLLGAYCPKYKLILIHKREVYNICNWISIVTKETVHNRVNCPDIYHSTPNPLTTTRRLRDPHNYLTEVSSIATNIRTGRRDILFLQSTFWFTRLSEMKRLRSKVITGLSVFLFVRCPSLLSSPRDSTFLETATFKCIAARKKSFPGQYFPLLRHYIFRWIEEKEGTEGCISRVALRLQPDFFTRRAFVLRTKLLIDDNETRHYDRLKWIFVCVAWACHITDPIGSDSKMRRYFLARDECRTDSKT